MVSKLIVRTVLLGVIALLSWAGWWTWSHQLGNIALKVTLFLIEGGPLLAATSLLIESFRSFGSLSVKKRSWKEAFFAYNAYEDGQAVRTCELFALRSMVLAFTMLMTAAFVVALWEGIKFLFSPHAVTVNLIEVGRFIAQCLGIMISAVAMISGFEWLRKKNAGRNQIFQWIVGGLYWVIALSILFGVTAVTFFKDPSLSAMPFYRAFLFASGVTFLYILFLGAVVGLGYALFKLAGKAIMSLSQKFPALAEAYDTVCPFQTIHFVE